MNQLFGLQHRNRVSAVHLPLQELFVARVLINNVKLKCCGIWGILFQHDLYCCPIALDDNVQAMLHGIDLLSVQQVGVHYLYILALLWGSNASTVIVLYDSIEIIPRLCISIICRFTCWNI